MADELELVPARGFIAPALRAEFPTLRLVWLTVEGGLRVSSRDLRRRLAQLSNRYHGATVVAMRTLPIPHAYRAFFRQIGLDPDVTRIPSEQAAVDRLLGGGFRSHHLVADALLVALLETGVPVWGLDADLVGPGGLGIRASLDGDRLGSAPVASELAPGRLVIADPSRVHALLFGEVAPGHEVSSRTTRIALFAVAVDGVPSIHVEEALWTCLEALGETQHRW
jgi:DNA/RNA-binding domain of Phe-tRNA-synthetase-like protein